MAYTEKTRPSKAFPKGGWKATYRGPDGRERSKTCRTKAEAETWLATEQADRVRGVYVDPAAGRITLAAYAEQWIAVQPWRASTVIRRSRAFGASCPPSATDRYGVSARASSRPGHRARGSVGTIDSRGHGSAPAGHSAGG